MNSLAEPLYSNDETAAKLGVAPATLPIWRHFGRGPAYLKVGKRCFYRPADIKAWLDKQLIDPARRKAAAA